MTSQQDRALKFAYFALGILVPVAALLLWKRFDRPQRRRDEIDRAHDITVEDSFPASDPPSAW
jgi:hypothetical protein